MDSAKFRGFLRRLLLGEELIALGFVLVAAGLVAASSYGYARIIHLSAQVDKLNESIASTTALLQSSIAEATSSISTALAQQTQSVTAVRLELQDQVGEISGTVNTLQKLTDTDKEFLAKYSKVFFLSENYAPARLEDIPSQYKYSEKKALQIIPQVLPHLTQMLEQAKTDGISLFVESAYRSFAAQQSLKDQYTVTYGAGTANQFSAEQGYSEHQLGTTADFITTGTNGQLNGFDTTKAYTWMVANAYRYGFILSYPKGNGYYTYEPWHWRFVGVKLATDLHKQGKNFYDLDQRAIDAYLVSLFD